MSKRFDVSGVDASKTRHQVLDAVATPPELSLHVNHAVGAGTGVRTGARGIPAIVAWAAVALMLIVVGGFLGAIAMFTHAPHVGRPWSDTPTSSRGS